jgi:hypothetical protein
MFFVFTTYSMLLALIRIYRLRALVYRVQVPESVGERIIELTNTAKKKGWITEDDNSVIDQVLNHEVFTIGEKENLNTFQFVENVKRVTATNQSGLSNP